MSDSKSQCCLTQQELIDRYFLEYRAKILDLAAYLDRLDRARELNAEKEFRYRSLHRTLQTLATNVPNRAEQVQMIFSDQNFEFLDDRDQQSAYGASVR